MKSLAIVVIILLLMGVTGPALAAPGGGDRAALGW